ncbi:MAG: MFS family permease [Planctomycetota bacterium]|jgi:MFS family permease
MNSSERKRALAAIFACACIYGLTLGLTRPLIALILESREVEKSIIGLVATMPAFGMLAIAPFMPRLIKSLGIKRFLISCLILDVCMLLCYPMLDFLYAWMAIGLVAGAATNALLVSSETWVNEIVEDQTRGRVLALYNALFIASMALGPLIIPLTGIQSYLPFYIGAGFVVLAAIPLLFVGNATLTIQGKSSFSISSFILVAPVLCFALLIFAWKEFAGSSLLPVYGVSNGMEPASAAVMLTVLGIGGLLLTFPFGWLADKMDRYKLLMILGVGILLGSIALPFVINQGMTLWILLFFWGGIFAGFYTVIMTIIGQRFRGMELVVANIAIGVLWGIGSLTGPSLTGIAMDIWDPHGFVIMFIAASSAFVLFSCGRWLMAKDRSTVL